MRISPEPGSTSRGGALLPGSGKRGARARWLRRGKRAVLAGIVGLDLLLASGCGGRDAGPHVILISIDTLRAGHVGLYGYERDTTPRIDGFFADGTVFENATSSAPCTIPSVRQYLSGGFDAVEERKVLAEYLGEQGYATAAVVSQHNFYRALDVYRRGFAHFDIQAEDEVNAHGGTSRDARQVSDRAIAWLEENAGLPKIFLWLHYFDPHDPYEPPEAFRRFGAGNRSEKSGDVLGYLEAARPPGGLLRASHSLPQGIFDAEDWAHFVSLYDGEIRFVDDQIGRVLDRLEALGLAERSIVVVIADHGEWLGESGRWNHCATLQDQEIRVPFLIRVNGRSLADRPRERLPASTLDVLPTLMGLLGIPFDASDHHGIDLREPPEDRVVASMWSGQLAIRNAGWKLISVSGMPSLLYQTARDPGEQWNRFHDQPEIREALAQRARPYLVLRDRIAAERIEERLHAIGYIR
jgi:arylsulfatase